MRRRGDLGGANVSRNQGIEASRGDYVVFLDSDDLLAPECLEGRVKTMESDPTLDFAVFMGELFSDRPGDLGLLHNVFTGEDDTDRFLRWDNAWAITGPIWRRQSLGRLLPLWQDLPRWQDWHLHVKALAIGQRYCKEPRVDYYIRYGGRPRGSIGQQPFGPEQAHAAARAFSDVAALLIRQGSLDECRKAALARLYWFCVRTAIACGDVSAAGVIWALAREADVVSERIHSEGRSIIYSALLLAWCPRIWAAVQLAWKRYRGLELDKSATFLQAKYEPQQVASTVPVSPAR
jgi:glycosyltransferase involved in cell wall biosynthesis